MNKTVLAVIDNGSKRHIAPMLAKALSSVDPSVLFPTTVTPKPSEFDPRWTRILQNK